MCDPPAPAAAPAPPPTPAFDVLPAAPPALPATPVVPAIPVEGLPPAPAFAPAAPPLPVFGWPGGLPTQPRPTVIMITNSAYRERFIKRDDFSIDRSPLSACWLSITTEPRMWSGPPRCSRHKGLRVPLQAPRMPKDSDAGALRPRRTQLGYLFSSDSQTGGQ